MHIKFNFFIYDDSVLYDKDIKSNECTFDMFEEIVPNNEI